MFETLKEEKNGNKNKHSLHTHVFGVMFGGTFGYMVQGAFSLRLTKTHSIIRRVFKEIVSQSLNIQINISYTFAWGRLDGRMNGQNNFKQPYDLIKLSLVT